MVPFKSNTNEVKLSARSEEHLAEMQNAIVVPIEKNYADKTTQYLAAGIGMYILFSKCVSVYIYSSTDLMPLVCF